MFLLFLSLLRLCTTVVQDGSPKKVSVCITCMRLRLVARVIKIGPPDQLLICNAKKPSSGDEGNRYFIWNSSYSFVFCRSTDIICFRDTRYIFRLYVLSVTISAEKPFSFYKGFSFVLPIPRGLNFRSRTSLRQVSRLIARTVRHLPGFPVVFVFPRESR